MTPHSYGETLLKVENVCLEYDGKVVLKNVNAEIQDILRPGLVTGQIVGFLGPSGIGKTSLFRIIAGLEQPTSGRVTTYNDWDRPVKAGEIGVVAQNYPLFDHMTVMQNLMFAARRREKDKAVARDKVLAYMEEFDLLDRVSAYPEQLSGGQRQRTAILQQLLGSGNFLLMDEPFSGLDLIILEKTCRLISKIANMDEKNTIIVVTHDVTAAASIADHLWLMGRDDHECEKLGCPDPNTCKEKGKKIPGARIIKPYNLIERDLCWHDSLITSPALMDFVREVKEEFRKL